METIVAAIAASIKIKPLFRKKQGLFDVEVAAFELRGVATCDLDTHLQQIGQLIAAATEGYMVDWPSVALH
ncbi:hypothetical protein [Polaromonas sp. A23]|uniref:hypothetical protein n=1 Tax=Polaromonas sp. A23 TaxID=1944133 RepID=UPI000986B4FB|nr:hypothetical protein [Polaromonas sp. A23]OOG36671.1 hypothetical protein B0B52_20450 [Polaromonas sp. A23]